MTLATLLNELSHLPQPFKQEQGQFSRASRARISLGSSCVIGQAGRNRSVVAIGQANDEVRICAAAHANELHALTMQGMAWMSDGHPFHRWLVKGGSVL
ncbi:hypothetical protein Krac_7447 [Ktedonobacter racemifer DSM 44963]|uniref:Uncharacterized protein n=1 Tax=Ktedonobacter racemifer DSM 44963 TaxID=485913 RepID=D6TK63_KTERA|nr:hypothetical protein Krac_7447 [Ktedonobacter racemifer DSM 44963]